MNWYRGECKSYLNSKLNRIGDVFRFVILTEAEGLSSDALFQELKNYRVKKSARGVIVSSYTGSL